MMLDPAWEIVAEDISGVYFSIVFFRANIKMINRLIRM